MLFEKLKSKIVEHAEEAFPNECLGVVVGGKYIRLENVSPDPENSFEMTEADELKYVFPEGGEGKAQAVVHSHPDGPNCPSEPDMQAQIGSGLPFALVTHDEKTGWEYFEWGDHMLDAPLNERPFKHGVTDCFSAVRAWFWQTHKVYLPDIARRDNWWKPGTNGELPDNHYADHFKKWGFVQLTAQDLEDGPQVGDCFLYKLHQGNEGVVANTLETHGGIHLGEGRIYHHLAGRLSTEEAADGWIRKASRWLRYVGEAPE